MKIFAACILSAVLAVTSIWGSTPAAGVWNPVVPETAQQDAGSAASYSEAGEASPAPHPGERLPRACQDMLRSSARFSVVGTSEPLHLSGEPVAEGDLEYPEFCLLLGVRLEWDGPSDGGPYTLTRTEERYGEVTQIDDITLNHFIDVNAFSGGIFTYVVSDGNTTSNPIVIDLSKFPPLEYIGSHNNKVIVLRIDDPYIYSAKDKESASTLSELTRIKPIDENNLGVAPIISNSRTLVPIATLVNTMAPDSAVVWDEVRRLVTIKIWGNVLEIPIDSNTIYFNNQARTFDTPAQIVNDRTLVPVRHLEQLGCDVDWIGASRSVVLCYQDA